ncbi:MAG: CopG family transcriptional regulator [Pleurocapsa sp.]
MGGKTDLDRVVAYIPTELKQELQEWADSEERSVSWVVAKLIDRAVRERKQQPNTVKVVNMR